MYYSDLKYSRKILNSYNITTVDPWTTWVWTVCLHIYTDQIFFNKHHSTARSWLVDSTDVERGYGGPTMGHEHAQILVSVAGPRTDPLQIPRYDCRSARSKLQNSIYGMTQNSSPYMYVISPFPAPLLSSSLSLSLSLIPSLLPHTSYLPIALTHLHLHLSYPLTLPHVHSLSLPPLPAICITRRNIPKH